MSSQPGLWMSVETPLKAQRLAPPTHTKGHPAGQEGTTVLWEDSSQVLYVRSQAGPHTLAKVQAVTSSLARGG